MVCHPLQLGDPVTGCDECRHSQTVEGRDRLLRPVKWPPAGRNGEFNPLQGHVDNGPAVQGNHGLCPADAPDIPDTLLQVSDPRLAVRVENIPDLVRSSDLPCAADPESDVMPDQVLREE